MHVKGSLLGSSLILLKNALLVKTANIVQLAATYVPYYNPLETTNAISSDLEDFRFGNLLYLGGLPPLRLSASAGAAVAAYIRSM